MPLTNERKHKLPLRTRFWCKANKLACILVPVIAAAILAAGGTTLSWGRWVDTSIKADDIKLRELEDRDADRLTFKDGIEMELRLAEKLQGIYNTLDARIDNLPPEAWKTVINETKAMTVKNNALLISIESNQQGMLERFKSMDERLNRMQTEINLKRDK